MLRKIDNQNSYCSVSGAFPVDSHTLTVGTRGRLKVNQVDHIMQAFDKILGLN